MVTTYNFTAAGAASWVAPGPGEALILAIGGGGGARGGAFLGNGAPGGGGGALAGQLVDVVNGDTFTINVGAGGAAGTYNTDNAGNGQNTTVTKSGFSVVAAAGSRGTLSPGAGGTVAASTGAIRIAGGTGPAASGGGGGFQGGSAASHESYTGGAGGRGGAQGGNPSGIGEAGIAPGGGGGGGRNTTGDNGGAGAIGGVRIIFMPYVKPSPGRYVQKFELPGASTWRAPISGKVLVQAVGGGSGGYGGVPLASGGNGGSGGGYSDKIVDVIEGQRYDIVVGSGGAGGVYNGGASGAGGDSSFSRSGTTHVLAKGATGWANNSSGGIPGQAADGIGDTKVSGYKGTTAPASSAYNAGQGGSGARPIGGPGSLYGGQDAGTAGTAPGGAGSGGGANSGGNGGAGARGEVRIAYVSSMGTVVVNGVKKLILGYQQVINGVKVDMVPKIVKNGALIDARQLEAKVDERLLPYPTWIAENRRQYFNRVTGVFKATPQTNIAAAVAAKNIMAVTPGDSLMEGFTYLNPAPPFNSTADRLNSVPYKMRDALATKLGGVATSTGQVRVQGAVGGRDPRWTVSGATDNGHFMTVTGSNYVEFNSGSFNGTEVHIVDLQGGGNMGVSIDGGTVVNYQADVSGTARRTSITGLVEAGHTVRITATSGSLYIVSAEVSKPAGIKVHNPAQGGSRLLGTDQPSWSSTSANSLLNVFGQLNMYGGNPTFVAIMLGANDMSGTAARDYDALAAAMLSIGERFDTATTDIILMTEPHGSLQFASPSGYSNGLYERMYTMAYNKGWSIIDLEYLTGGFEALAGYGYTGDVFGHYNAAGAAYVGNLMADGVISLAA